MARALDCPGRLDMIVKAARLHPGEILLHEFLEPMGLTQYRLARRAYLTPALKQGVIEMPLPDKPKSRLQKYRLRAAGRRVRAHV